MLTAIPMVTFGTLKVNFEANNHIDFTACPKDLEWNQENFQRDLWRLKEHASDGKNKVFIKS